jgi:hypothetical protein
MGKPLERYQSTYPRQVFLNYSIGLTIPSKIISIPPWEGPSEESTKSSATKTVPTKCAKSSLLSSHKSCSTKNYPKSSSSSANSNQPGIPGNSFPNPDNSSTVTICRHSMIWSKNFFKSTKTTKSPKKLRSPLKSFRKNQLKALSTTPDTSVKLIKAQDCRENKPKKKTRKMKVC